MPKADQSAQEGYTPKSDKLEEGPGKALEKFARGEAKRVPEQDRSVGSAMRIYLERVQAGDLNNAVDALQQVKDALSKFAPKELVSFYTTILALNTVALYSEDSAHYDAVGGALGRFGTNRKWGTPSESPAKSIISPDAPTLDMKARGDLIHNMIDAGLFDSPVYFGPRRGAVRAWGDALKITETSKPKPAPKVPPVR